MSEVFDLKAIVSADATPFENAMDSSASTVDSSFRLMSSAAKAFIGNGVIRTLMDATRRAYEFGQAIADISSISNLNMQKLSQGILQLENVYGRSRTIAESIYETISSGIDGTEKDYLNFVKLLSHTSVSIRADLESTTNVMTTLMNAYGVGISEAERLADMLYLTVREGKAHGNELAKTFGLVTNTAAEAGVRIEEMVGVISVLSRTQSSSQSMIGFNQLLNGLINPTIEARQEAEKWGIEIGATALQTKGLTAILTDMHDKIGGNVEAINKILGNIRAMRAGVTLTGEQFQNFIDIVSMAESQVGTGVAAKAFEKQTQTMSQAVENLKIQFDKTFMTVGSHFEPITKSLVTGAEDALKEFTKGTTLLTDFLRATDAIKDGTEKTYETIGKWEAGLSRLGTYYVVISKVIEFVLSGLRTGKALLDHVSTVGKSTNATATTTRGIIEAIEAGMRAVADSTNRFNSTLIQVNTHNESTADTVARTGGIIKSIALDMRGIVASADALNRAFAQTNRVASGISAQMLYNTAVNNVEARRDSSGRYHAAQGKFISREDAIAEEMQRLNLAQTAALRYINSGEMPQIADRQQELRYDRQVEKSLRRHRQKERKRHQAEQRREQAEQRAEQLRNQQERVETSINASLRAINIELTSIPRSLATFRISIRNGAESFSSVIGKGLKGLHSAFMYVSQALMAWDIGTAIGEFIRHTLDTDELISREKARQAAADKQAQEDIKLGVRARLDRKTTALTAGQVSRVRRLIDEGKYTDADALLARYLDKSKPKKEPAPQKVEFQGISDLIKQQESLHADASGERWRRDEAYVKLRVNYSYQIEKALLEAKKYKNIPDQLSHFVDAAQEYTDYFATSDLTALNQLRDDIIEMRQRMAEDGKYGEVPGGSGPRLSERTADAQLLNALTSVNRLIKLIEADKDYSKRVRAELMTKEQIDALKEFKVGYTSLKAIPEPQQYAEQITDYRNYLSDLHMQWQTAASEEATWLGKAEAHLSSLTEDRKKEIQKHFNNAQTALKENTMTAARAALSVSVKNLTDDILGDIDRILSSKGTTAFTDYYNSIAKQIDAYAPTANLPEPQKIQYKLIQQLLTQGLIEKAEESLKTATDNLKVGRISFKEYEKQVQDIINKLPSVAKHVPQIQDVISYNVMAMQLDLRDNKTQQDVDNRQARISAGLIEEHEAIEEELASLKSHRDTLNAEYVHQSTTASRRNRITEELATLELKILGTERRRLQASTEYTRTLLQSAIATGLSTEIDVLRVSKQSIQNELNQLDASGSSKRKAVLKAQLDQLDMQILEQQEQRSESLRQLRMSAGQLTETGSVSEELEEIKHRKEVVKNAESSAKTDTERANIKAKLKELELKELDAERRKLRAVAEQRNALVQARIDAGLSTKLDALNARKTGLLEEWNLLASNNDTSPEELQLNEVKRAVVDREIQNYHKAHALDMAERRQRAGLITETEVLRENIKQLNTETVNIANELKTAKDDQSRAAIQHRLTVTTLSLMEAFMQLEEASRSSRNSLMSAVHSFSGKRNAKGVMSNDALYHSINMMALAGSLSELTQGTNTPTISTRNIPGRTPRDTQEILSRSIDAWIMEQKYSQANVGKTVTDIYDYMLKNNVITVRR